MEHYCRLIDEHGTDFWWQLPMEKLLPNDFGQSISNSLIKGKVGYCINKSKSFSIIREKRTPLSERDCVSRSIVFSSGCEVI